MTNPPFPIYIAERQQNTYLLVLQYVDQICVREPTFTIYSLTVHHFNTSAVSLSSNSRCGVFFINAHHTRVGGLAPSEHAFLTAIDWPLSSSSFNSSASSTAPTNTDTKNPSSTTDSTWGTPGSNPGTSGDEMTFGQSARAYTSSFILG